jgi:hypothetical protein
MYLCWVHRCASDIPFPSLGAILGHIPYIEPILDTLTGENGILPRLRAFGRKHVARRLEAGASRKDLFYHLVSQSFKFAYLHLTKVDYRVVRNSLKQSAPLSKLLHRMAC